MAPNLQYGMHLRDDLELLYLIETHFILHPQLISYIHASEISRKCFQTTSSPFVPSCHSIFSVGI